MTATARTAPGQRQEFGIQSRSLMGLVGAQALGPSSTAFQGALTESWIGSRAAGTQAGAICDVETEGWG